MNAASDAASSHGAAQRQARVDLAACHRLASRFGFNEGIDNHLTMLVPGYRDRFYLAPFGLLWSEVRARDFLELNFHGDVLVGRGLVEDTALHIHLMVHRHKPDATCVLHTHMPYATALSTLEEPELLMIVQSALGFAGEVAYVEYEGLALDHGEGERLARALGEKCVLILRNHGALVTGATVAQAFERLYFLERACQVQILALGTGRPVRVVNESVVRATAMQFRATTKVCGQDRAALHFSALKRLLDRSEPDYAE